VDPWRRVWFGLGLLTAITAVGTLGFVLFGLSALDALYQTITTISTVGFREVEPFGTGEKLFTIVLVLAGVGTALYTLGVLVDTLVEERLSTAFGRRRMRRINELHDHVIVCGWGRVGRTIATYVTGAGRDVVVVERDADRAAGVPHLVVNGDATEDGVLGQAGIDRARTLIAALDTDAGNVYITLSARALRPDLFIVARARVESAVERMEQAGADRVVNPQQIGGARMAAFALQPHVAEFLDVVMHDGSLEFRLEEVVIPGGSAAAGRSLRDAHLRDRTGALVLAMRDHRGRFNTNPPPDTVIEPGQVLIAIGTTAQLAALSEAVLPGSRTLGRSTG
jgi:voltage-gated potassium channel